MAAWKDRHLTVRPWARLPLQQPSHWQGSRHLCRNNMAGLWPGPGTAAVRDSTPALPSAPGHVTCQARAAAAAPAGDCRGGERPRSATGHHRDSVAGGFGCWRQCQSLEIRKVFAVDLKFFLDVREQRSRLSNWQATGTPQCVTAWAELQ